MNGVMEEVVCMISRVATATTASALESATASATPTAGVLAFISCSLIIFQLEALKDVVPSLVAILTLMITAGGRHVRFG